jgi:adenylate kinase
LAPTELVVQVVEQQIAHVEAKTIIFDGSPRRPEEIDPFFKMLSDNDISISLIVIFQMSRDVAFKRLTGRRKCSDCGKIYNVHYDPPEKEGICDKCGGRLVQRQDDKPNLVNERLQEFEKSTVPVIRYFRQNYTDKIFKVDAQKSMDKVANVILAQIQKETTLEVASAS